MSRPEHRLILGNRYGPVTDRPDWVSLDVLLEFELDDGTWVATAPAKWQRGGPLNCSREQLEQAIRDLVFSEPNWAPGDPRAEPPLVVEELQRHGTSASVAALAALPFIVTLSDEVEAARADQYQRGLATE